MSQFSESSILQLVAPATVTRCSRLRVAVVLVGSGTPEKEARKVLRERFGIDRCAAWRLVTTARQLVGEEC